MYIQKSTCGASRILRPSLALPLGQTVAICVYKNASEFVCIPLSLSLSLSVNACACMHAYRYVLQEVLKRV